MCDFLVHRTHLYKPRLSSILSLAHNSTSNHLLAVLRSDHSDRTMEHTRFLHNWTNNSATTCLSFAWIAHLAWEILNHRWSRRATHRLRPDNFRNPNIMSRCRRCYLESRKTRKYPANRRGNRNRSREYLWARWRRTSIFLATSVCKQSARITRWLGTRLTTIFSLLEVSIEFTSVRPSKKRAIQQINVGKLSSTSNRRGQKTRLSGV